MKFVFLLLKKRSQSRKRFEAGNEQGGKTVVQRTGDEDQEKAEGAGHRTGYNQEYSSRGKSAESRPPGHGGKMRRIRTDGLQTEVTLE